MEAKQDTQETLLAELRGLRGDLAEVLKGLPCRTGAELPWLVRWVRLLDRSLLSPPHTFQSVLALVLARLPPTAPRRAEEERSN